MKQELKEAMKFLEANHTRFTKGSKFLELELKGSRPKPSIEEPSLDLELKALLPHLNYVFLNDNNTLPLIFSSSLTELEEGK